MDSRGVRVPCAAGREGQQRAADRRGQLGHETEARDPSLGEEAALNVSGNGLRRRRGPLPVLSGVGELWQSTFQGP